MIGGISGVSLNYGTGPSDPGSCSGRCAQLSAELERARAALTAREAQLEALQLAADKAAERMRDAERTRLVDALRASGINAADALAVQALYAAAGQSGSHRIVSALQAIEAWLREGGAL